MERRDLSPSGEFHPQEHSFRPLKYATRLVEPTCSPDSTQEEVVLVLAGEIPSFSHFFSNGYIYSSGSYDIGTFEEDACCL